MLRNSVPSPLSFSHLTTKRSLGSIHTKPEPLFDVPAYLMVARPLTVSSPTLWQVTFSLGLCFLTRLMYCGQALLGSSGRNNMFFSCIFICGMDSMYIFWAGISISVF